MFKRNTMSLILLSGSLMALEAKIEKGSLSYSQTGEEAARLVINNVNVDKEGSAWSKIGAILYNVKGAKAYELKDGKWAIVSANNLKSPAKVVFFDKALDQAGVIIGKDPTVPKDINPNDIVEIFAGDKELGFVAAFDAQDKQLPASAALNAITRAIP